METEIVQVFLVICAWLPIISSNGCSSSEKCICFHSDEYEYLCPPEDFEITIVALPDQYVKMYCEDMSYMFNLDKLPAINAGNADYFSMSYCPLPKLGFSAILNKFNMLHLKTLVFDTISSQNITITKSVFEGLSELESLNLRYGTLSVEDDFLTNTPNVHRLSLHSNNINYIGQIFNYSSQLKYLDLSRNKIVSLPTNMFNNVPNLEILHLWRNNLTVLNKEMFTGLKNLKLLELSINKISTLSEDVFSELRNLVNISLRSNELGYIASGLFQGNSALESVRLGKNSNLQLSDYVFANLTSLKHVNIDESNLIEIPRHLFQGSFNLEFISISKNKLKNLPKNLFQNLTALRKINLSHNQLSHLPDSFFHSLSSLTELFLQNNAIETINNHLFKHLSNLVFLHLEQNKIAVIENKAFTHLEKLRVINLAHNKWNYSLPTHGDQKLDQKLSMFLEYYYSPLNACHDLEEIDFSFNFITDFPADLFQWKAKLKKMNLASNFIGTVRITDLIGISNYKVVVDLSKNDLDRIDFSNAEELVELNFDNEYDADILIILNDNTIHCDCFLYDLARYNNRMMNPNFYKKIEISQRNFRCSNLDQMPVIEVKPIDLSCTVGRNMGCPQSCDCQWKQYDQSIVVDCSYRNLTEIPVILSSAFDEIYLKHGYVYNQTVVNLEGNQLFEGPMDGMGYQNVTGLNLVNNQLRTLTWIPPRVEVIQLDNNKIEILDEKILAVLENSTCLKKLSLSNNPWICDCSASSLQIFLVQFYKKVDIADVTCFETGVLLISKRDLCQVPTGIIIKLNIILFFLLVLVTTLALYYRCKRQHDRTMSVLNPVLGSRRTIPILSNKQDDKKCGLTEPSRIDYHQEMNNGKAKVRVVVDGYFKQDSNRNEVKADSKINTYFNWGDQWWFWEQIGYALPYSKQTFFNIKKNASVDKV